MYYDLGYFDNFDDNDIEQVVDNPNSDAYNVESWATEIYTKLKQF
jgi:hypothetical protein